jgi:hypothetical protein
MIIFSQGIAGHSRIGNSLVWMSRASGLLKAHSVPFCFPYAWDYFNNYLDPKSIWLDENLKKQAKKIMTDNNLGELNGQSISEKIRPYQLDFEKTNNLSAFEWRSMLHEVCEKKGLVICGDLKEIGSSVIEFSKKYHFVILHEPFPFEPVDPIEDYQSIMPSEVLINESRSKIKDNGSINIGCHIRRGDYAEWQGGKYYFVNEYWIDLIRKLKEKKSNIYIYSNELDDEFRDVLSELGCILMNGSYYEDFVAMMFMDEIYGPPSTYTGLAVKIAKNVHGKDIKLVQLSK